MGTAPRVALNGPLNAPMSVKGLSTGLVDPAHPVAGFPDLSQRTYGLMHVTTTLKPRDRSPRKYTAEFVVDTGATDSLAPAKELKKAGIRRRGRMAYELANGQTVGYDFGLAEIEFLGEITSGRVIFGPDDADPILGVTALESVGTLVDPANCRWKRMPAIPLK